MQPNIPLAIGAGFASAVMLTTAARAPSFGGPLLFLVGFPIALSGLASNAATSFGAAFVGVLLLAAVISTPAALAFAVFVAVPTAFLVHRALLHRDTGEGATQWYPPGRIVLWSALVGGAASAGGMMLATKGGDIDALKSALRQAVDRMLASGLGGLGAQSPVSDEQKGQLVQTMLTLLPGTIAAFSMVSLLACLWLGGQAAHAAGKLGRPWPYIPALAFPAGSPLLLAVTLGAGLLLEGLPRLVAWSFSGALVTGYVLIGLAIVHHTTAGLSWRGPLLSGLYASVAIFSGVALPLLAIAGLVDAFIPLRRLSDHSENAP